MPHFRTWDHTYYDFHQEVGGDTFEFVGKTKDGDPSGTDPELEPAEISLLQKTTEPSSPYEGKDEAPPADDQANGEGNGSNVFGFEDLFGLGDAI